MKLFDRIKNKIRKKLVNFILKDYKPDDEALGFYFPFWAVDPAVATRIRQVDDFDVFIGNGKDLSSTTHIIRNGTELRFLPFGGGANYVGFKAPNTIAANKVWNLPNVDGAGGEVLGTDGSQNLGWYSTSTSYWVRDIGTPNVLRSANDGDYVRVRYDATKYIDLLHNGTRGGMSVTGTPAAISTDTYESGTLGNHIFTVYDTANNPVGGFGELVATDDGGVFWCGADYQAGTDNLDWGAIVYESADQRSRYFTGQGYFQFDCLTKATAINLIPQASPPSTDNGTIYYNSGTNKFNFREHGAWVTL